jgi:multidrug efflux pump subunit AcrB
MMGMTMVVGIVTEVAIFYFSEYEALLASGTPTNDARLQAGVNRFRPIAMTTLAAIFALLPLALGLGQGSAMQQPLAIAIISGLIVQMPRLWSKSQNHCAEVLAVMPLLVGLLGRMPLRGFDR